jgi:hypothetical protein
LQVTLVIHCNVTYSAVLFVGHKLDSGIRKDPQHCRRVPLEEPPYSNGLLDISSSFEYSCQGACVPLILRAADLEEDLDSIQRCDNGLGLMFGSGGGDVLVILKRAPDHSFLASVQSGE